MKIIIGYDKEQIVLAAVSVEHFLTEYYLAKDILDMLRSGLTVNVVETPKIVIGEKFDWSVTKITRL